MDKNLVIGAAGFIGHNLVKRLKKENRYVVGLDLKKPEFETSPADEFIVADARDVDLDFNEYNVIYQLAADMGGAGFIFTGDNDFDVMTNSLGINLNVVKQLKDYKGKIFFSSSACAYPDEVEGKESDAYPANPPYDYGWEKLISERLYQALNRNYGVDIRIARFQNCFGENGTFKGGREKAPAAICRKVAESTGVVEVWGDGQQIRPFVYIEDLLDGIENLMNSNFKDPINLGPEESITIEDLTKMVIGISGKDLEIIYVDGPTGERQRKCDNTLAKQKLCWEPKRELRESMAKTYKWIEGQL